MLRFAVFDENGPATEWPLVNAYLCGPDDLAIPGEIRFCDGEIICTPSGSKATGLALQYNAGVMGNLILQTCLLPASDKPYVLSHELARHRIKTFLVKSEEWQMFELSGDHPATQTWERARQLFTKGLNEKDPVRMDRFGRASLEHAIDATEKLAMAHAEVLLHRRYGTKSASGTTLGVRIAPHQSPEARSDLLTREFDVIYIPLHWRDLEVREGEYDWGAVDRWMVWAQKQKKPVVAGPLLNFSQRAMPEWMYVWQHDYDTCRDMAYDHIEKVFQRYHNVVSIWSIAAGLNVNNNFEFTQAQMLDLTRMANLLIRQGRRGRTMLEIVHPFGEHTAKHSGSIPPLTYIDRVVQEGIRVNCYGVQIAFGDGPEGIRVRDLMQVSDALDKYFLLELPVLVTSVGIPSADGGGDSGHWHEPPDPEGQARWVGRTFPLVMSKPHVESFVWSDLRDYDGMGAAHTGLLTPAGEPKPALERLLTMRRRLRKPIGPLRLPARASRPAGS